MSSDRVQQLLGDPIGICVKKADPLWQVRWNLRQPGEQVCEAMLHSEIFAVARRVLANEVQFTNPHAKHPSRFVDNAFETTATELATELRDHAERAGMIASLGDLDVGRVLRCRENPRR